MYTTFIMQKTLPVLMFSLCALMLFSACKRQPSLAPDEQVISKYPGGEIKETAIITGPKTNSVKIKSFVYYRSSEKKKEYSYKDNNYFGPWTYWYRNGSKLAEGTFDKKTLDPFTGIGSGTYYWPDGKKMMRITATTEKDKDILVAAYFDDTGKQYSNDDIPEDLKKKIVDIITRWDKGEI